MPEEPPPRHEPVLREEVVRQLAPQPGKVYVDGTLGLGGHALALFEREPALLLVGIDRDGEALELARARLARFAPRLRLVRGDFRDLDAHLATLGVVRVAGVLLDLGLSSYQVDTPRRGFSFRFSGPLDMRMDPSASGSAAELISTASAEELAGILRRYGEEPFARRIAAAIVAARSERPIETTDALAEVVRHAVPQRGPPARIDAATRTFQALRIAVNDELPALREGLAAGFGALEPSGTIVVLSYHSLEDRIVKDFLREKASSCTCPPDFPICVCGKEVEAEILTRKPVRPDALEVAANPRSRSAKLRAARKVT